MNFIDSRYLNTIQLCIRANKFAYGDRLLEQIRRQKVYLVLIAIDSGEASRKKIMDKCVFYHVPHCLVLQKQDLISLFKKDIAAFGITDKHLAEKLTENLNKGGFYYEIKK